MHPVRERRLIADELGAQEFARASAGRVAVVETQGSPVDSYRLLYFVRSVVALTASGAVYGGRHYVRVQLPAAYPAVAPVVTVLTPLVHPHVWPNGTVCLGAWQPGQKMAWLLERVGALLCFAPEAIHWNSVVNRGAAEWARANQALLPVGERVRPERVHAGAVGSGVQGDL